MHVLPKQYFPFPECFIQCYKYIYKIESARNILSKLVGAKTMAKEVNEVYTIRWVCMYSKWKISQKAELNVVSHPLKWFQIFTQSFKRLDKKPTEIGINLPTDISGHWSKTSVVLFANCPAHKSLIQTS